MVLLCSEGSRAGGREEAHCASSQVDPAVPAAPDGKSRQDFSKRRLVHMLHSLNLFHWECMPVCILNWNMQVICRACWGAAPVIGGHVIRAAHIAGPRT